MKLVNYDEKYLPEIVSFWNRNLKNKRNYFSVTSEILKTRIFEKKSLTGSFNPAHFLIATDQKSIMAVLHFGIFPINVCKAVYPNWQKEDQGYIAFILVDEKHRRKGIGTALFENALKSVENCSEIILDGQCINPFYGNMFMPSSPFFGTPEGISVEWDDVATLSFFKKFNYKPRYKAVELILKTNTVVRRPLNLFKNSLELNGLEMQITKQHIPELGFPLDELCKSNDSYNFESIVCLIKNVAVADIIYYPMNEVDKKKYAIYKTEVSENFHGKGIGNNLLNMACERMIECGAHIIEVVTVEELSPDAIKLYTKFGFKPDQYWAIF